MIEWFGCRKMQGINIFESADLEFEANWLMISKEQGEEKKGRTGNGSMEERIELTDV